MPYIAKISLQDKFNQATNYMTFKLNISLLCGFCRLAKELHCIHTFKTLYLKYAGFVE